MVVSDKICTEGGYIEWRHRLMMEECVTGGGHVFVHACTLTHALYTDKYTHTDSQPHKLTQTDQAGFGLM